MRVQKEGSDQGNEGEQAVEGLVVNHSPGCGIRPFLSWVPAPRQAKSKGDLWDDIQLSYESGFCYLP